MYKTIGMKQQKIMQEVFFSPEFVHLSAREKDVLARRFGLNGVPCTLQECADEWGLTREMIRLIQNEALDKLNVDPWAEDGDD